MVKDAKEAKEIREEDRDIRELARDIRDVKDIKDVKSAILRNLIWVITVVVGVGTVLATVNYQGKDLERQKEMISSDHERIAELEQSDIKLTSADEKSLIKLEAISEGIKDLKGSIAKLDCQMNERMTKMSEKNQAQFDEVKKILYKPVVIGGMYGISNLVSIVE